MRELRSACAVLFAAIAGTGVLAQQPAGRDLQIELDVTSVLAKCDRYTIFDDVAAEVRDGVVTLTGKVTQLRKSGEIERQVRGVSGVTEVHNLIEPLPASRLDDQIRSDVFDAIYRNRSFLKYGGFEKPPIHIVVESGHVTLTGTVVTDVDRRLAQSLALRVGTLSLTNKLKTEAEARAGQTASRR